MFGQVNQNIEFFPPLVWAKPKHGRDGLGDHRASGGRQVGRSQQELPGVWDTLVLDKKLPGVRPAWVSTL